MMSEYDLPLVAASFLVAVLAAYAALFFGARLTNAKDGERRKWLAAGAVLMGTGVWTMHFVGMRAMPMDVAMTFDVLMTAVSWLAAVVASGIALHIIGRERLERLCLLVRRSSWPAALLSCITWECTRCECLRRRHSTLDFLPFPS